MLIQNKDNTKDKKMNRKYKQLLQSN